LVHKGDIVPIGNEAEISEKGDARVYKAIAIQAPFIDLSEPGVWNRVPILHSDSVEAGTAAPLIG
jgi:hypothetical protein